MIDFKGLVFLRNISILNDQTTKLSIIKLAKNKIGDIGCIQILSLSENEINENGIRHLSAALLMNKSLKRLSLDNNNI